MSNRNFSYYGNNRLQQQTYARNVYLNNTNGKQIIHNPRTSNGNSSNFNTYREGTQNTYSRGLLGGETVSLGGIFGISAPAQPIPAQPIQPIPAPVPIPVPTPIPTPVPTPVPIPVPTPVPTPIPTPVPTPIPTPIPTCPEKRCIGGTFTTNAELERLRGCTIIDGDLIIESNITDLSILNCLTIVNGNVEIRNIVLTNISIPSLISSNNFFIYDNTSTNISFNSLTSTGIFAIETSTITSISFNSLTNIGELYIYATTLPTISGFNSLRTTGPINITYNSALTSISGFNSLTPVTGISGNIYLTLNNASLNICLSTYNKINSAKGNNSFIIEGSFTTNPC